MNLPSSLAWKGSPFTAWEEMVTTGFVVSWTRNSCSSGVVDRKFWLIVQPWAILDDVLKATVGGQVCFT